MKVKLALLDQDRGFLEKVSVNLQIKYGDKLELYTFTDAEAAVETVRKKRIDVLMATPYHDISFADIPERCGFAYLCEAGNVEEIRGRKAICKYQKIDSFYKQVLDIYSDCRDDIAYSSSSDENGRLVIFTSPCGGVGTSSMAAAYAMWLAENKQQALYLNLEAFGSSDVFFRDTERSNIGEVIYSSKGKKGNLPIKIKSCVKKDTGGVAFFSPPKVALDMLTLTSQEIRDLVGEIQRYGEYQTIVVDVDFRLDRYFLEMLYRASVVVWVSDGSESANEKIRRAYSSLRILEEEYDLCVSDDIRLIYNRFSNKVGSSVTEVPFKNIGGTHRFDRATTNQVLRELAKQSFFKNI